MKKLFLALPLAALAACSSDQAAPAAAAKDVVMRSDIDGLAGWMDPAVLAKEQAHSGVYSLKVDQGREFSPGYTAILGQLSPTRLRGMRMEAWAYMPNKDAGARLGFTVKDAAGGKDILSEGINLNEQVQDYGKWTKISKEFTFPPEANYSSQLVIFLWRGGATAPAYVDDIQLTALR